jgi:choline dehydrogenase
MSTRTTIVVGSGSTGGALAARLSEDADEHVILVEAGPDYATADDLPSELRDAFNPQLEGVHDWALESYLVEPPEARAPAPYPRGRVVGGSSSINGAIAQRGYPEDFDAWSEAGNPEWGWEQVLPCYREAETDLEFGDSELHGDSGPIPIMRLPREEWPPAVRAFEQAALQAGFPECIDHNDPSMSGIGRIPRNQLGTLRAGTLLTYVSQARGRPNFELRANSQVLRVTFDRRRASGVEIETGGEIVRLEADRVVICAGFIKSPQLLMASGIGPRENLLRVGIEPLVDAPGVGAHVLDHAFAPIVGLATDPDPDFFGFRCELKYPSDGSTTSDIQIFPSLLELSSLNFEVETDLRAAIMCGVVLGKPRSAGRIAITSSDARRPPEVHMNFMADSLDRARMAEAVRTSHRLISDRHVEAQLRELMFPTDDVVADDGALDRWLYENITTGFHGACSCRMGPAEDPTAVVDQYLEVHGVEGLHVADASIMPDITTGMTNLTCYMIGERAAQLLRAR